MDPQDKARQVARYLRQLDKSVPLDEQKRRKRQRQGCGPRARRSRDWDGDDELVHEKIRRSRSGPPVVLPSVSPGVATLSGLVVGLSRGRAALRIDGSVVAARLSGDLAAVQQSAIAVGDEVRVIERADAVFEVVAVEGRRSFLARPDPQHGERVRLLAANVDVAVLVLSLRRPALRLGLIDRLRIALARGQVEPLICINKLDLAEPGDTEALIEGLAVHEDAGLACIATSAATGLGIAALRTALAGRTAVFVGHSGVGKSSLLNALDPGLARAIGRVNPSIGKGRHTTTSSGLFELACGGRVIDTPGIREFGVGALSAADLAEAFPEIAELARTCRYRNCAHAAEPGCAVRAAGESGALAAERWRAYQRLREVP